MTKHPALTCVRFFEQVLRQPNGELFKLYDLQRSFLEQVWDTYSDVDRRPFRHAVFCIPKKLGKSTGSAGQGLYHLTSDTTEDERELFTISADADQGDLMLELAKKMIRHSPTLARFVDAPKGGSRLLVYQREIVFEDAAGGVHKWKVLASDGATNHGVNPSLVLVDEGWQLRNYDQLEAVALGPQRKHPMQLWSTYVGLKQQQVAGNPLWDIFQRAKAGDLVYEHELDIYQRLPAGFISDGYLAEQKAMLPINRYKRLHLNERAAADATFLTEDEVARIQDGSVIRFVDDKTFPAVLAIDYGRSVDATAIVVAQLTPGHIVRIPEIITLQGSRENPVPLALGARGFETDTAIPHSGGHR